MKNRDNSPGDEEQFATPPMDYRALLAMTRPLVITERTILLLQQDRVPHFPSATSSAISPKPGNCSAECALKRGEIFRPDEAERGVGPDGGPGASGDETGTNASAEVENDSQAEFVSGSAEPASNLRLRIHLGMS